MVTRQRVEPLAVVDGGRSAWECPGVAEAMLARRRSTLRRTSAAAALPGALLVVWLVLAPNAFAAVLVACLLLTYVLYSIHQRRRHARMRRILEAYPWRVYRCQPNAQFVTFLTVDGQAGCTFKAHPHGGSRTPQDDVIWLAGDVRLGGMLADDGGANAVRVVRAKPDLRPGDPEDDELARAVGLVGHRTSCLPS